MKVFVVYHHDFEGSFLQGIFANHRSAEKYLESQKGHPYFHELGIEEEEVIDYERAENDIL